MHTKGAPSEVVSESTMRSGIVFYPRECVYDGPQSYALGVTHGGMLCKVYVKGREWPDICISSADNGASHPRGVLLIEGAINCGFVDGLLTVNGDWARVLMKGHESESVGCNQAPDADLPFSTWSGEQLQSVLQGLFSDEGYFHALRYRVCTLIRCMIGPLVSLRNRGEITLDANTFVDYLALDRIIELTKRADMSDDTIASLKHYLWSVPGCNETDYHEGRISGLSYEQHGYIVEWIAVFLNELADRRGLHSVYL